MAYKPSPTSLVLNDPYLLQSIFDYFPLCNLHSDFRRTRQNLVWVALTSRTFLEPAMNVLWRKMESILPLYLVLPALRKEDGDGDGDSETESESEYTLTEPLNSDDVQRMMFYARRIRSLHFQCDGNDYPDIHQGLAMAFFTRINQLNAFLSLRELTVGSGLIRFQHDHLRTISLPNLEDLSLSVSPQAETITNSFLEALACKSHCIKTLVVMGKCTDLTFGVLPKFSKIQMLKIFFPTTRVISLRFLEQISSSMTSLRSLSIDLGSSKVENNLKNSVFQFISLTNLVVDGDPHNIGKLLEFFHTPLLCHLSLTVHIPGSNFDTHASIRSFIPVRMIDKVRSLSLLSWSWFDPGPPIDFGSQIISFEQLEVLRVSVQTLQISITDLTRFLTNNRYLSNLQRLTLQYDRPPDINQSLSIAALSLITNACPKLSYLAISIYHPDRPEMHITARPSHNLRTLKFMSLPDWDDSKALAIALSSFLDHRFPGLTELDFRPNPPKRRRTWWKDVQDAIKALQTRRLGGGQNSALETVGTVASDK